MIALIQSWQTDCAAVCRSQRQSLMPTHAVHACVRLLTSASDWFEGDGRCSPTISDSIDSGGERPRTYHLTPSQFLLCRFADLRSVVYGKWANVQVTHTHAHTREIPMRRHLTRTTHLFVAFGKQHQIKPTTLRNVIRARMRVIKWIEFQGAWMRYNEPMMMMSLIFFVSLYNFHIL